VRERGAAWVTASAELVTAGRTAEQFLTYVASGPFPYAVAGGFERNPWDR
jgi:hypothetical protein